MNARPQVELAAPVERAAASSIGDAWKYPLDFGQRSVLFWDTLRKRANNMLAHERAGNREQA